MNTAVIGLGKLGAALLAVLAHRGHSVIGLDTDYKVLRLLRDFTAPVKETELQHLLDGLRDKKRLTVSGSVASATLSSDIVFVIVPTPSQKDGQFSTAHVREVASQIGLALLNAPESEKQKYRLFVLVSTVMPGQSEQEFLRVIEEESQISSGEAYGVCYNPEFIALGSVIRDMLAPDLVLIGESDERAGKTLSDFYASFCTNKPPIVRMNFVNAELAKLCLNCYVTTKISYANMIAELCEAVPEADVDVVTEAIGIDGRIGRKYLKGATAFGGPCFPRDNIALRAFAKRLNVPTLLPEASHQTNLDQTTRLLHYIHGSLRAGDSVAILGTAYKLDTDITEESAGEALVEELKGRVPTIIANSAETAQQAIDGAAIVLLMLPFSWANTLDYTGKTVIDCWRVLKAPVCKRYIPIGVGALED